MLVAVKIPSGKLQRRLLEVENKLLTVLSCIVASDSSCDKAACESTTGRLVPHHFKDTPPIDYQSITLLLPLRGSKHRHATRVKRWSAFVMEPLKQLLWEAWTSGTQLMEGRERLELSKASQQNANVKKHAILCIGDVIFNSELRNNCFTQPQKLFFIF